MTVKSTIQTRCMTSILALGVGMIAPAVFSPAHAQSAGVFAGGSSLTSLIQRQIEDCYGKLVANDGYSATTAPRLAPGQLPSTCGTNTTSEALYAAVGSGSGLRAFIAHDPKQLLNGPPASVTTTTVLTSPLPPIPPVFVDSGNSTVRFHTYPYPSLSFAASDSPLPTSLVTTSFTVSPTTNWLISSGTTSTTATVSLTGQTTATYDTTNFGAAVQLPAFEAPVAIAVNTNSLTGDQTKGAAGAAGNAVQLSIAQLCAIFSGTVTNWNSQATIEGWNTSGALATQAFDADNVTASATTVKPYSPTSLPIKVVFRSDGSGTSFIFTNFLHTVCPALNTAANNYSTIFGNSNLPSTSFSTLIANIEANSPNTQITTIINAQWSGQSGSANVAAAINTNTTNAGAIGYLSADFTQPYADTAIEPAAPLSASVQDEFQRASGINTPALGTYIAPSTSSINLAFVSTVTPATTTVTIPALTPPATTATSADWNLYAITYPTTTATAGEVAFLAGKSVLGIPAASGAYPLAGTTFLFAYSCYAAAAPVNFLNYYFNTGLATAATVIANNGFSVLNGFSGTGIVSGSLLDRLQKEYLTGGTNAITTAGNGTCTGTGA